MDGNRCDNKLPISCSVSFRHQTSTNLTTGVGHLIFLSLTGLLTLH